MRIIVAKTAGFCMGVRRAVDLALEHSSPSGTTPVYTLGKLIHNASAMELLVNRGARVLDESTDPPRGAKLLIRAHGVPPTTQQKYETGGHLIIDGTCPKVKTVHRVIERYREQGYSIVISGDKGHAEVIGLLGYAGDAGYLIQSVDDIDSLPQLEKICLVSQTTFDKELFETIAQRLRERFDGRDVVIKKTICSATEQRQDEIRRMAGQVDAIIVVGGKDSANTLRLASIARNSGTPTQLVETEQEIDWPLIAHCETVGVTAGASTPHWMIKRVVDQMQFLSQQGEHSARSAANRLFDTLTYLNVIVAAGAAALYYASCVMQAIPYKPVGSVIAFLYFLSMYLWNSLSSMEMTQHLGMNRYRFYRSHRPLLFTLASLSIALLLVLSYMQGSFLFYLMVFATVAGTAYHVTIFPRFLKPIIRYRNLRDIPTSRDLFVALAWGIILTIVPGALERRFVFGPESALTFVWVFSLAFLRSVIFDLRDIEGDRIMGRETLVSVIGERRARIGILAVMRVLLLTIITYSVIALFASRILTASVIAFLSQLPVLLYLYLLEKKNRAGILPRTSVFTALMDAQFLLAGAFAAFARLVTPF